MISQNSHKRLKNALFIFAAISAVFLTGCASSAAYYPPPDVDQREAATRLEIDDARCTAVSHGAAPMPQVSVTTAPTSYTQSGSIKNVTPGQWPQSSYTYSGTTAATPNAAASFTSGMANGMNLGAAMAASSARKKIYHGCMLNLGWRTSPQTASPKAEPIKTTARTGSATPAEDEWRKAVSMFMEMEAASPGGIDYMNERSKLELFDVTVRTLAKDPANSDKSMSWFLVEANRMVKEAYRIAEQ